MDTHARSPPLSSTPPAQALASATSLEREVAYATLLAALAVAMGLALERLFGFDDLSLVFMTAVIFVAVRTRMGVAVYAATLCFLAYNFFFMEPRHTFYITARHGLATVTMFLVAALACGRLANRLRTQVIALRTANADAEALQHLSHRLTAAATQADALDATIAALRDALDADVAILLADEGGDTLTESPVEGAAPRFDPALQAAARHSLDATAGGDASAPDPEARELSWHCLPLAQRGRRLGVVCLRFALALPHPSPERAKLAEAMVRDLAQALERLRLSAQLESARVQVETERLRAALLSSVSHDLRSPLATIIGSAESLDVFHEQLSVDDQLALARDILAEGQRLDRYIQNLLDMTRLGHGAPAIEREWIGLDEVVGAALARLRRVHPGRRVDVALPTPAPLLRVNPALVEQALLNVLDNAAKFSDAGEAIALGARVVDQRLEVDIADRGVGIVEAERGRVFDMFHSAHRGDRNSAGSGMGLAICRAILVAHEGGIVALAGAGEAGTTIRMHLPLEPVPAEPRDD